VIAKPQSAAVEAHPTVSGRPAMVQLAALGSEDAARDEWQKLAKRMPELLNGRRPVYSRTDHDGHTFWRIRTSGFADVAQARAFCDHVRQKGGTCSVADF
jgi:SPOR domain